MSDKIQMTEEQANEIYNNCILEYNPTRKEQFIKYMKKYGYIRKSELQQKVEEAEESIRINTGIKPFSEFERMLYETIQLLKQSHPEFKK